MFQLNFNFSGFSLISCEDEHSCFCYSICYTLRVFMVGGDISLTLVCRCVSVSLLCLTPLSLLFRAHPFHLPPPRICVLQAMKVLSKRRLMRQAGFPRKSGADG